MAARDTAAGTRPSIREGAAIAGHRQASAGRQSHSTASRSPNTASIVS